MCDWSDGDWPIKAGVPSIAEDYTLTVTGATGDFAPLNGSYIAPLNFGWSTCPLTSTIWFAQRLNASQFWNCFGTGFACGSVDPWRVDIFAWFRTGLGISANLQKSYCIGADKYYTSANYAWGCDGQPTPPGSATAMQKNLQCSPVQNGSIGTATLSQTGGGKSVGDVLSAFTGTDLGRALTQWLCGGAAPSQILTLNLYDGPSPGGVLKASGTIPGPWSVVGSGPYHSHAAIPATTLTTINPAAPLYADIFYGNQTILPNRSVVTGCDWTGHPNPIPAGYQIQVKPPNTYFENPSGLTLGDALNTYILRHQSINSATQVVNVSGGAVVGAGAFEFRDHTTWHAAKLSGSITGSPNGALRLDTVDGYRMVGLPTTESGCITSRWIPAGFLECYIN